MNVNFVNPVLHSVVNILKTMANVEASVGKPELKKNNKSLGIVSGLIALEGAQTKGSLAISFSKPVILELVKRMLREDKAEVDDMAKDLTGEIANMALGSAKSEFEQNGLDFNLTLPTVLTGEDHLIEHKYKGPTVLLPFSTSAGKFYVEICFST